MGSAVSFPNKIVREALWKQSLHGRAASGSTEASVVRQVVESEYPELDISIVSYNSSKWLEAYFLSLLNQDYPCQRIRLLIRDNGSQDDTVAKLESLKSAHAGDFADFLITVGENVGFGRGHNDNLFSRGRAPFSLVSNLDLVFQKDTLTQLVVSALLDDESVAGWECRQKPFEHPKHYHPATLETLWSSSACMLFRRAALERVRGYEPKLFLYGEDVELSYRLRDYGYRLRYMPKAEVWHYSYEHEHHVKPAQFLGSTLANMLLRLRYGKLRHILTVLPLYFRLLRMRQLFPGQRAALWKNFGKLIALAPYFLFTRKKSNGDFPFSGWDYEIARIGAFYRFPEQALEQPPLVSVLVRTMQGRAGKLVEAVQSVVNQTYPRIELVVVEDGSDTARIFIEDLAKRQLLEKVVYQPLPRSGRCRAGNEALKLATGELMCFLDDDDLLYADHFEVLVNELVHSPELGGAYSLAFEAKTEVLSAEPWVYQEKSKSVVFWHEFSRGILWHHNYIPIQSIVFRRALYEQYGGFDPELDNLEDWNLWVRYSQELDFRLIEKVTSLYRVPACVQQASDRRDTLISYYDIACRKHDGLQVKLPLPEVRAIVAQLEDFKHGYNSMAVSVPRRIMRRVPFASRLRSVFRRLLGMD